MTIYLFPKIYEPGTIKHQYLKLRIIRNHGSVETLVKETEFEEINILFFDCWRMERVAMLQV